MKEPLGGILFHDSLNARVSDFSGPHRTIYKPSASLEKNLNE